jgi:hypothetical protein
LRNDDGDVPVHFLVPTPSAPTPASKPS